MDSSVKRIASLVECQVCEEVPQVDADAFMNFIVRHYRRAPDQVDTKARAENLDSLFRQASAALNVDMADVQGMADQFQATNEGFLGYLWGKVQWLWNKIWAGSWDETAARVLATIVLAKTVPVAGTFVGLFLPGAALSQQLYIGFLALLYARTSAFVLRKVWS